MLLGFERQDQDKWLKEVRTKVVSVGDELFVRMEDVETGASVPLHALRCVPPPIPLGLALNNCIIPLNLQEPFSPNARFPRMVHP